jgi:hypothetical protein
MAISTGGFVPSSRVKLSNDPAFAEKLHDVVGLYVSPPAHARHPRWTFHFTPTSSSWLNAVEGFFAILTGRRLQHGVFRRSSIFRRPSTASSTNTTRRQSHSSGEPTQTQSSPHGTEGSKRWSQSTRAVSVESDSGWIPKQPRSCESASVIAREASHGAGLQPGFA